MRDVRTRRDGMFAVLRTRPGAFTLALISFLMMAGGIIHTATLPAYVNVGCSVSGSVTTCSYEPQSPFAIWLGLLIAAAGLGLLVVAWRFDRRPDERPRLGWKELRRWGAPLLWLAVIPIGALPLTFMITSLSVNDRNCTIYGFIGATADCPAEVFLPAVLIPGLLNAIPLWWLRTTDERTRIAAIAGSILGLLGFVASLSALVAAGPVVTIYYGIFSGPAPPWSPWAPVIWLSTLIALLVIAKLPLGADETGRSTVLPRV